MILYESKYHTIRMSNWWWLFAITIIGICIPLIIYAQKEILVIKVKVDELASSVVEMSPDDFFDLRNKTFGGRGLPKVALKYNFAGIYILFNKTKNMYYVGQAQQILNRVNNHFTGKGNGDVYADYKYGDEFTIKMVDINKSKFTTLNELERNTIMTYDAHSKGYNKTRGNR